MPPCPEDGERIPVLPWSCPMASSPLAGYDLMFAATANPHI